MGLYQQLAPKRAAIVRKWFDGLMDTYPAETADFLRNQKDQFANPIGQTTHQSLQTLFDLLVNEFDPEAVRAALDPVIRIRAIQDFTPSQAVGFVFQLKRIVRESLPGLSAEALTALDHRIDELGLLAFDIYMRCREQIYDLKANEVKERTFSAFSRAGLVKEPADE